MIDWTDWTVLPGSYVISRTAVSIQLSPADKLNINRFKAEMPKSLLSLQLTFRKQAPNDPVLYLYINHRKETVYIYFMTLLG